MDTITLIHPFQVAATKEKEFLNAWKAVDQYMQQQAGFIETKLHRLLKVNLPKQPDFNFINIAIWKDVQAFKTAIDSETFRSLAKPVLEFSCGPGLFEVIE